MRPDLVRTPTQHIITVTYGLTFPQKTKKHKNTNMAKLLAKLYWLCCNGGGVRGHTLFEEQLPLVVGGVAADVLLDVRVLVVVDADTLVPRGQAQPPDQAGLTHRGLPLDQDRVAPAGNHKPLGTS